MSDDRAAPGHPVVPGMADDRRPHTAAGAGGRVPCQSCDRLHTGRPCCRREPRRPATRGAGSLPGAAGARARRRPRRPRVRARSCARSPTWRRASRSSNRGGCPSPPAARRVTSAATIRWRRGSCSVAGDVCGAQIGVGIADGRSASAIASRLAARRADRVLVVPAGTSPEFVEPLAIGWLRELGEIDAELVDLFVRLGIRTLGRLAALDPGDVLSRFGTIGLHAHRLAGGADLRPSSTVDPHPGWWVEHVLRRADRAAGDGRVPGEAARRRARGATRRRRAGMRPDRDHGRDRARRALRAGVVPRPRALGDGDRRAGALAARGLGRAAGWAQRRRHARAARARGGAQRRRPTRDRCGAGARRPTRMPPAPWCGSPAWPASRRSRCRSGRAAGCRPSATGWCRRPRSISTIRPNGSTAARGRGRVRTPRRHRRSCRPSRCRSSCSPATGGRWRSPVAARSAPHLLSWSSARAANASSPGQVRGRSSSVGGRRSGRGASPGCRSSPKAEQPTSSAVEQQRWSILATYA